MPERLLVGPDVLVPEAALLNVARRELPPLVGAFEPFEQPPALLFPRDVEEELQDVDAVLEEVSLEVVDLLEACLPEALARYLFGQSLPL